MKKLSILTIFLFLISFVSCYKEPIQDCSGKKICYTITHSYVTCENDEKGNPIFFNIQSDTVIRAINECKTDQYIRQAYDAEARLYAESDSVEKKFISLYPVKCDCQ